VLVQALTALVLGAIGGVTVWQALELGIGSLREPGAGLWPFILGCLLLALTTPHLAGALLGRQRPRVSAGDGRRVLVPVAVLAAFSVVLDGLGFVVAALLLVAVVELGICRQAWRRSLLLAVVCVMVSWALFTSLGVPLPRGRMW
jgi:hypothetical protein